MKMTKIRVVAIILAVALLSGGGYGVWIYQQQMAAIGEERSNLIVGTTDAIDHIEPAYTDKVNSATAVYMLFDPLVKFKPGSLEVELL